MRAIRFTIECLVGIVCTIIFDAVFIMSKSWIFISMRA